ncbi:hypothetical protein EGI31_07830 [Lacihabitans soyangensis]|uniref:Uncharacterized protein n=1 Tax=Lacihabitans soyangensis TaxID=869394 RepID=A0AAE3KS94_9BACT|nr:hypothetical protein [Lacihabitans soyangensis]
MKFKFHFANFRLYGLINKPFLKLEFCERVLLNYSYLKDSKKGILFLHKFSFKPRKHWNLFSP